MDDTRLSSRLYQILEVIGASEHIRLMYSEQALTHEILDTAYNDEIASVYQFGSSYEGTTTPGMKSDVDVLACNVTQPVVERLQNAPVYGPSYLMVTDYNTMPGYFRLHRVFNGVPQSFYHRDIGDKYESNDALGRICLKHIRAERPEFKERNGPADTCSGVEGIKDIDAVTAFRCEKVPLQTNTRLHKDRPCNWLSQTQIQTLRTNGCFFVGVGHPQSQTKSIEWRISFSLQERELMSSLNSTQHKCYILLKMIKKNIIQPRAGVKSISSYHCKTCLFYVLENTRPEWWTRTNLIQGVRVCLSFLLRWVKEGNCPNYFIPEENMFDRLQPGVLQKVAPVLCEILNCLPRFLLSIQCDNIDVHFRSYISEVRLSDIRNQIRKIPEYTLHFNTACSLYHFRNQFLQTAGNTLHPKECLFKSVSIVRKIENTDTIRDRCTRDVRAVMRSLMPHIHLQIAQSIMSVIISNRCEAEIPEIILHVFKDFIQKSEDCDLISSKLLLATFYLHANMLDKCDEVLLTCETLLHDFVISICKCRLGCRYGNETLDEFLRSRKLSSEEFRRACTTGCMLFLPGQASLVHPALQLEMYRSVNTPPGSRDEDTEYWFDWILVDSRVYLYFLQYLLYSRTNNEVGKIDAINNLLHLIKTDRNLGHRETACNLLGWIFSQENRVQDAFWCFQESWRTRPVHNAAKWHLLIMRVKAFRQRFLDGLNYTFPQ